MLLLSAGLLIISCGNKEEKPQLQSYPVVEAMKRDITDYSTFPARIEGTVNVEIRPKISGFLEKIYVDEGQWVRKSQKLFKLEARSLEGEVDAAASAIEVAKANVATQRVEVEKLIPLVEDNIISDVQLHSAEANLKATISELEQARNNYNSLKENLDYQYVFSPVDGVVGNIPYRQGTLVGMDQDMPLTTVSQIDSVYVYFSMNEKEYFSFLKDTGGNTVQNKIERFPGVILMLANQTEYNQEGRVQTTTGQIDQQTGTATFRAIFPNPDKLLNSGNSGQIKIPKTLNDVLLVPVQAIMEEQSKKFVYRVDKYDTVRRSLIKTGETIDNLVVVKEGIKSSDKILAGGLNQVQNNSRIKPRQVSFDSLANSVKPVF